ncbi:hypothetical protein D6827_03970 [Candidatus Parcubacteria bacterium]|nr:MAG: hypothetical protein D6827_03970 [Candidatus Parcubacteria bacterium]
MLNEGEEIIFSETVVLLNKNAFKNKNGVLYATNQRLILIAGSQIWFLLVGILAFLFNNLTHKKILEIDIHDIVDVRKSQYKINKNKVIEIQIRGGDAYKFATVHKAEEVVANFQKVIAK